jgi:hypothetical protein
MPKNDLTLLFVTAGKIPEKWAAFHKEQLDKLPYPIITLRDEEKINYERIYQQMLIGAKQATTPFVATIEDDVLYPPEHFAFRPPLDTFAYNQHRWALFTWGKPTYNWRNRKSNCSLIAPRELMIEALEERFAKWPQGMPPKYVGELGRERVELGLGVALRKSVEWYSTVGIIQINHDNATEERQKIHWKDLGPVKAYDIPYWGKAEDLIQRYA